MTKNNQEKKNISITELKEDVLQSFELLYESIFPKQCSSCKKIYNSFEEILESVKSTTGDIYNLKDYQADLFMEVDSRLSDKIVVANFLDCTCGSTMIILGKDRRSDTSTGKEKREFFNNIVNSLVSKGETQDYVTKVLRVLFRSLVSGELKTTDLDQKLEELFPFEG